MIIFHLALSNVKKRKGMAVTLVLLSLLAALFMNLGLIIQKTTGEFYAVCAERLNSPDFFLVVDGTKYKSSFEEFLRKDERVDLFEKEEIIFLENTENSANSSRAGAVIFNKDAERSIETFHALNEMAEVPESEAIYLPKVMENAGAVLGEPYILTFRNRDYPFRVKGFFETSCMGTTGYAFMKFYLPGEAFGRLYESAGAGKALSVRLREGLPKRETADALKRDFLLETDYYAKTGGLMVFGTCFSYSDIEYNMADMLSVAMALLASVALIVCVITCIVVFFKVKEEIEESMTDIGCLQAMGYTTRQIMLAKVGEFCFLGAAGGAAGILCSYVALPFTFRYGEGMIGIFIQYKLHPEMGLLSLVAVMLLLGLASVAAAWKIRRITPVTALRRGIRNYHFGRDLFPLEKGRQPVIFRLALKSMFSEPGKNSVTVSTIALGVFSVSLTIVLYANFVVDNSALIRMTGIEVSDVRLDVLPHVDTAALQMELEKMPEVRKTNRTENYMAKVDGEDTHLVVSDDFGKTEMITVIQGVSPEYDNEVVLTSLLLKTLGKRVGDTVRVKSGEASAEYLIVGVSTGTNNMGNMGMMTLEGVQRIHPYYTMAGIDIYLTKGASRQDFMDGLYRNFSVASGEEGCGENETEATKYASVRKRAEEKMKKLLSQYGASSVEYAVMLDGEIILSQDSSRYQIKEISSLNEYLEGQLSSYAVMLSGLVTVILLVMFLVMGAIISVTIASLIRRQKTDFGIYKALGFSTKELVGMVRLSFILYAAAGSVIGAIAARLLANRVFRLLFFNMGLDISEFKINSLWLAAVVVCTMGFVGLVSTWKACRIRKISVYGLLTE